ncbi:Luciferin 4-monooxygenase [Clarias magur]|uniref:Luciferin 4-monooxygenase n=1 Tax=Clarias magur TaxID=1594786 RepID=A0A8J4U748_CLAMG|nr:Luciferin 4-monooxygenase [Clarias magur]
MTQKISGKGRVFFFLDSRFADSYDVTTEAQLASGGTSLNTENFNDFCSPNSSQNGYVREPAVNPMQVEAACSD